MMVLLNCNISANMRVQAQPLIINEDDDAEEDNSLQNTSDNRSQTDKPFLALHGLCLIILAVLFACSLIHGDIDRLKIGYDDCGNVCGKNNFYSQSHKDCDAQDMTNKPFLQINGKHRKCVAWCNYDQDSSRFQCISNATYYEEDNFIYGVSRSLYQCIDEIIALAIIAIVYAFIMILMMRYKAEIFVWFVMLTILLVFAGAAVFYANLAVVTDSSNERNYSIRASTLFIILTLVVLYIICSIREYVELLIQLLKEAGKAITAMPSLLLQPSLTFMSLVIIWSFSFYFSLWIASGGTPKVSTGKVTYVPTAFMCLADLYNVFMMLWMGQFVCGCQNMIIAGAVSTWYFARDKSKLGKPIEHSTRNLIRYHLGTISVTSVIIALLQFVRYLIYTLRRSLQFFTINAYCVIYVEQWMRYYTENSCIITAMHGNAFREAGSRAFKLIVESPLKMVAITSLADVLLVLAKILVAQTIYLTGCIMFQQKEYIHYAGTVLIIVWLMAYMIAHCLFSVYEAAINTIFICFCEDREVNDGFLQPYFMSAELKEFVQKSHTMVIVQTNTSSSPTPVLTIS